MLSEKIFEDLQEHSPSSPHVFITVVVVVVVVGCSSINKWLDKLKFDKIVSENVLVRLNEKKWQAVSSSGS